MSNVRYWHERLDQPFELAGRRVYPASRRIEASDQSVVVEPRVMAVLLVLAENAGRTVRRQTLIETVWNGAPGADQSINNALSLLRRALGDQKSADQLIRTVPKQGYSLSVSPIAIVGGPEPIDAAEPPRTNKKSPRKGSAIRSATAAVFIALALAATWFSLAGRNPATSTGTTAIRPNSIVVFPFVNLSGDPGDDYFADGLAEEVLHALTSVPALLVTSGADALSTADAGTPISSVARRLGAENFLQGSVRRSGGRLRVTALLTSTTTETQLWSSTYDSTTEEVLNIQQSIAINIATSLDERMTGSEPFARLPTRDPEAYENYLIGQHELRKWTPEGNRRAVEFLEKAVALDNNFAEARLALGRAYYFAGTHYGWMRPEDAIPRVKASVIFGAADVNPATRAAALAVYGDVLAWNDHDWDGALSAYGRAYELTGQAPLGLGLTYSIQGQHEEAVRVFEQMLAAGPGSYALNQPLAVRNNLAWALFNGRRYERAILEAERVLAHDESFADGWRVLGRSSLMLGRLDAAIDAFSTAANLMSQAPIARSDLAVALAATGRSSDARKILDSLEQNSEYVAAPLIAQIHLHLGDVDATFRWLEKAFDDGARGIVFLKVNPFYDPIRSDPRYSELLTNLNLSHD